MMQQMPMRLMLRQPMTLGVEQGVKVVIEKVQGNTQAVKDTGGGLRSGVNNTQHSSAKRSSTLSTADGSDDAYSNE